MAAAPASLPDWALAILRAPGGGPLRLAPGGLLQDGAGRPCGRIDQGVARFTLEAADDSIAFYREVGGAHFHERAAVPFAMTSLDTPVYHGYVDELGLPPDSTVAVDVGGGDGRNAMRWLGHGCRRVVVVDAVLDALVRFRARVATEHPEWLERLLCVEADARALPLAEECAGRVIAIEALAYLNEDYATGVRECARILSREGRFMVSDRDYEGGLLMRLFYFGGVPGMLAHAGSRDLWDGRPDRLVRSRAFTEAELTEQLESSGLRVLERKGVSALSLVLSDLRARGGVSEADAARLSEVHELLRTLGREGAMRRAHVIVGAHFSDSSRSRWEPD